MANSYEYWDIICNRVNTLRAEGLTFLQIEEETGYDYEDILWAVHQDELLNATRDAV
jgi:hypothetical protein